MTVDRSGQRRGRLVALRRDPDNSLNWIFLCDCGSEKSIRGGNVFVNAKGSTVSCGCHRREMVRAPRVSCRKHGASKTATYRSWNSMIGRCERPSTNGFDRYGGRGVSVCERWKTYANFLLDMGERPSGTSLDRIDGAGNYEPSNCRWATLRQQALNKPPSGRSSRNARLMSWRGITDSIVGWAARTGLSRDVITRRLDLNWPVEEILTRPKMTPRETTDHARSIRDRRDPASRKERSVGE